MDSAKAPVSGPKRLHRLQQVRRQEGVSIASMARRMGMSVREVQEQEQATDLPLSILYRWQAALKVPIEELLSEPNEAIASALQRRTQLVRLAKTTLLLMEQSTDTAARQLSRQMFDVLLELMPELADVNAWPTRTRPRESSDCSRILTQQVATKSLPPWFDDIQSR